MTCFLWWNTILPGHHVVACIRSFLLLSDEKYSYCVCIFLLSLFIYFDGHLDGFQHWTIGMLLHWIRIQAYMFKFSLQFFWIYDPKCIFFILLGNSILLSFLSFCWKISILFFMMTMWFHFLTSVYKRPSLSRSCCFVTLLLIFCFILLRNLHQQHGFGYKSYGNIGIFMSSFTSFLSIFFFLGRGKNSTRDWYCLNKYIEQDRICFFFIHTWNIYLYTYIHTYIQMITYWDK